MVKVWIDRVRLCKLTCTMARLRRPLTGHRGEHNKMAEWLLVAGLSLLIMATVGLVRQAAFRGDSTLLFLIPLAGLRQVQENWQSYGVLALLRVLGTVCLLVGAGLIYVQHGTLSPTEAAPGQVLRGAKSPAATTFVRSPEAALLMVQGDGKPLTGVIHGRPLLNPVRVTLINGVLSIHQGEAFLPDLSVSVLLGWRPEDIQERRTLLITPAQSGGPPVHVSWKPEGRSYPETRIFKEGYRLELALAPLDDQQFTGALQLVLPDTPRSYLVGDFTVQTNHLRYRNGKVDLFFDHPDTLGYVAREYLHTQFPVGAVASIHIENVNLRRAAREGEVQARVELQDGTVERRRLQLEENSVGWAVTPGSMETKVLSVGAGEAFDGGVVGTSAQDVSHAPAVTLRLHRFTDLASYLGQAVTVIERDGKSSHGTLTRVNEERLWLEMAMGSGRAEINLSAARLRELVLADGTRLVLESAHREPPAAPERPATENGEAQYEHLIGVPVTVTLDTDERHQGTLVAVDDRRVTLSVAMGSGEVEYFFDLDTVTSIEEAQ